MPRGEGLDKEKRRQATLYDAVAGRVAYEGFQSEQFPSKYRDTTSTTSQAVPPEEVLFRRKDAPIRYEEDDLYFANRKLSAEQKLPDSDLLKIVHAYAADMYAATSGADAIHDYRSMDETALLAMGILLEEAASVALGKTGDLALLEPEDDDFRKPSLRNSHFDGQVWRRNVVESKPRRNKPRKPTSQSREPSVNLNKSRTMSL